MDPLKAEHAMLREKLALRDRSFDAGCVWGSIVATQHGRTAEAQFASGCVAVNVGTRLRDRFKTRRVQADRLFSAFPQQYAQSTFAAST